MGMLFICVLQFVLEYKMKVLTAKLMFSTRNHLKKITSNVFSGDRIGTE